MNTNRIFVFYISFVVFGSIVLMSKAHSATLNHLQLHTGDNVSALQPQMAYLSEVQTVLDNYDFWSYRHNMNSYIIYRGNRDVDGHTAYDNLFDDLVPTNSSIFNGGTREIRRFVFKNDSLLYTGSFYSLLQITKVYEGGTYYHLFGLTKSWNGGTTAYIEDDAHKFNIITNEGLPSSNSNPVPEPYSIFLLAIGFSLMTWFKSKRK